MTPSLEHELLLVQLFYVLFAKALGVLFSVLHKLSTSFSPLSPGLRFCEQ